MSSNEESDEEAFESADEDLDYEQYGHQVKNDTVVDNKVIIDTNQINNEVQPNLNQLQENCEEKQNEEKKDLSEEVNEQFNISLVEEKNENDSSLPEESLDKQLDTNQSISTETNVISDEKLSKSEESSVENVDQNKSKEQTIIKGRKLLRKADRIKTLEEETSVSDDKKSEVLNKLANIGAPTNSRWNNWLSDIKSAAVSATSTTVNHASNWSLNPKSILTGAATITSQVVGNVGAVVESAIGAPPPEQMAAYLKKERETEMGDENRTESASDQQKTEDASNSSKFNLGFVNYTLNTLELIGKKTMEVIVDDSSKAEKKE